MMQTRPPRGDSAVTVVIGTILLAALAVALLATVQLNYVPVWRGDAQAQHVEELAGQFADLRAALDRQVDNRTLGTAVSPFRLAPGTGPAWIGPPDISSSSVAFTARTTNATIALANFVQFLPPPPVAQRAALNETWLPIKAQNLSGIENVVSFRIRADAPDAIPNPAVPQWLNVTAYDASRQFAGSFTFTVDQTSPDASYRVTVCQWVTCTGDHQLFNQTVGFHASAPANPFWVVNAMDPGYRFDLLLASAAAPLTLVFNHTSQLAGDYALVYDVPGGNGTGGTGGGMATQRGNVTLPTFQGGTLVVRSTYTDFPDQDYVLEDGAFAVRQGTQAGFKVDPSFAVQVLPYAAPGGANLTAITLGLPSLVGAPASLATKGTAAVTTSTVQQTELDGEAATFRLNLTTAFPALWADFWNRTLGGAGLKQGTDCASDPGQYCIAPEPGGLALQVTGFDADDACADTTCQDLAIEVRQAYVNVILS